MNTTYNRLTYEQRYTIETMLRSGHTPTFIARALGRSPSTITREIGRNSRPTGLYRCKHAQVLADENMKEGHYKHVFNASMEKLIREKLGEHQWSPEQICGWCDRQGIDMVSHERIYQFIWQEKANGGQLHLQLRHGSKKYRKRYGSYDRRGGIPNRVSIDERPPGGRYQRAYRRLGNGSYRGCWTQRSDTHNSGTQHRLQRKNQSG